MLIGLDLTVVCVSHSALRELWCGSANTRGTERGLNRTLPCVAAIHADIVSISRLDDVMESLHHVDQPHRDMCFAAGEKKKRGTYSFFDGGVRIEPFVREVITNPEYSGWIKSHLWHCKTSM